MDQVENNALKQLINTARYNDNLSKGLHEVCKALECTEKPVLCVLAKDCKEDAYKKLVEALCR